MKIDEYGILGVSEVLKKHSPEWQRVITDITRNGIFIPGGQRRGASIAGTFEFKIDKADHIGILSVLEAVRQREGPMSRYGGQAITMTIDRWRRFGGDAVG